MSTKTANLGLVKPDFSEFTDSWHIPLNKNFDIIDDAIGLLQASMDTAKGTQASVGARLDVSLNADGSLKDVPEIATARNSTVYGADNGTINFSLDERLERGDREAFDARAGASSLLDAVAFVSNDFAHNSVISGPTNFLTFTGANVKADGSSTPIVANISGYKRVIRTLKQVAISGAAGTYYIYLDRNAAGTIILDRTLLANNTGNTALDGFSKLARFTDSSQNFVTSGVQPGDILEITTTGSLNAYQYIVKSVDGPNTLSIYGWFESVQSNLNYKITNPLDPVMGFTATAPSIKFAPVADRIFIGSCVFDGANVTSLTQFANKGRYEEWFSVSLLGGDYLITATHKLGYIPTKISLYASQANDYTQPLEPLAVAQVSGVGVTDDRACIADMSLTTIRVKNATNGIYYKDFSGVSQVAGFLLIVAER